MMPARDNVPDNVEPANSVEFRAIIEGFRKGTLMGFPLHTLHDILARRKVWNLDEPEHVARFMKAIARHLTRVFSPDLARARVKSARAAGAGRAARRLTDDDLRERAAAMERRGHSRRSIERILKVKRTRLARVLGPKNQNP